MADSTRQGESLKDLLKSSIRSTAFWSYIAAIVGVVALAAGGLMYLLVQPIRDFAISVLIIGMVLLFAALVLSPRAVAIFLVGRRGRYGTNVVIMTAAFFAIVVLVNFLLFRSPTRVDVTATRALTLAPQTVQVLNSVPNDVRANAFFVPSDERYAFARQQAEDLLNEFRRNSTRFQYRFIDPELQKSLADSYDVNQYPMIVFEDLAQGRRQKVTIFNEPNFVTGILVATGADQKRVYYLTGHNEAAITRDATGAIQDTGLDLALDGMQRDNYRVLPLNLKQDGSVPQDAAALVIAGPKRDLDQQEFTILTDYIKRGGRVLLMLDPNTPRSFVNLIRQWGVTLENSSVADAVSNVSGQMLTPLAQRANSQFTTSGTTGIPIADQIDSAFFPQSAAVQPLVPPQDLPPFITITPLVITTPASWLETDPENVNFTPGTDLPGPFFIGLVVEAQGTIDETQRHNLARLVIFGDSDFASNRFFASMNNTDLLLNSVNWLAEDYDLISIRPKPVPFRALVVNRREREFIKWSSWLVPPSLMLIMGAAVWWRRR